MNLICFFLHLSPRSNSKGVPETYILPRVSTDRHDYSFPCRTIHDPPPPTPTSSPHPPITPHHPTHAPPPPHPLTPPPPQTIVPSPYREWTISRIFVQLFSSSQRCTVDFCRVVSTSGTDLWIPCGGRGWGGMGFLSQQTIFLIFKTKQEFFPLRISFVDSVVRANSFLKKKIK